MFIANICKRESHSFLLVLSLVLGILIFLFSPVLLFDQIFTFRDIANWYGPSLQWTAHNFQHGNIPLWNDLQGIGTNWVGEGTTTVFYPGTWLLAIPVGSFHNRLALVILLHFLLAFLNTYRAAKSFHLTPYPALLAATCYTLCTPTLASHNNWPFLISATWLPMAIGGLWQIKQKKQIGSVFSTSIALSLMILGGDPQCVYHFGLVAILLLVANFFLKSNLHSSSINTASLSARLGLILLLTLCASAIQLWPTWLAAKGSVRSLEVASKPVSQSISSNSQQPRKADTEAIKKEFSKFKIQQLEFSQPPWHLTTLVWGNVFGTTSRFHARWDKQFPTSDRLWNPNLYQGLIPFLFCLSSLILLRKEQSNSNDENHVRFLQLHRWMSWILVLFSIGSFGWYGLGWIWIEIQNIFGANPETTSVNPETGGVYWLLTFLPGFSNFRYPAKLWTVASFAIAIHAGLFLDYLIRFETVRSKFIVSCRRLTVLLLTSSLLLSVFLCIPFVSNRLQFSAYPNQNDFWLGTFFPGVGYTESMGSLLHCIVVALITIWFISKFTNPATQKTWLSLGLIIFTALELSLVNGWVVFTGENPVATKPASAKKKGEFPKRVFFEFSDFWNTHRKNFSSHILAKAESKDESPVRFRDQQDVIIDSMNQSLYPQFHLLHETGSVNAFQTLYPASTYLLQKLAEHSRNPEHNLEQFLKSVAAAKRVKTTNGQSNLNTNWLYIAINWTVKDSSKSIKVNDLTEDLTSVWLDEKGHWKPLEKRVVLDSRPKFLSHQVQENFNSSSSPPAVKLIEYSANQNGKIMVEVSTSEESVLVVRRLFDPGWVAVIQNEKEDQLQCVRVNRLFCGFAIPKGNYKLAIEYRPAWFALGKWVSLSAWLLLLVLFFCNDIVAGTLRRAVR